MYSILNCNFILFETIMKEFIRPSQRIWTLADCDSFYASCEVARRPNLKGKPVCVCRDRDIVLAATYEAKALGVGTGTASRDAKKILGEVANITSLFINFQKHLYDGKRA